MYFSSPRDNAKIWLAMLLMTSGCSKLTRVISMNQSLSAIYDAPTSTDAEGTTSGNVQHDGKTNIRVRAQDGHGIDGAAALFPVGSLAMTSKISMRQGEDLSQDDFALAMDLKTKFIDNMNAVKFSSDPQSELLSPVSLYLPLPTNQNPSSLLSSSNYAVLYESFHVETKSYHSGILAPTDFTVEEGKAVIKTKYFGTYQAIATQDVVDRKIEMNGTVKEIIQNYLANKVAIPSDKTNPTIINISSISSNGTYALNQTISIKISFSEPVDISGSATILLNSGGTATYANGSGTSDLIFTYTVAGSDQASDLDAVGSNALTVSGSIADAAGNAAILSIPIGSTSGSLASNSDIVVAGSSTYVTSVSSTTANGSYNSGDVVNITVTFSAEVNVTGTPQITLETGTNDAVVDYTSGTGTDTLIFAYTVGASHEATDLDYVSTSSLALNGGTIATKNTAAPVLLTLPAVGSANSIDGQKDIAIDNLSPTVIITSNRDPGPTRETAITLTFTFSEPIAAFESGDISISGASKSTFTFVSHTVYTLDIVATNTNITADISQGAAQDAAGNNNTAATQWSLTYDTTSPTVLNVSSSTSNGSYNAGDPITVVITFDEIVTVTGTPQITLETGATDAVVDYNSAAPSTTMSFIYTVASGHNSSDLELTSASALALNGGTIKDRAGNNATLTVPISGASSLSSQKNITIDTTAPIVTFGSISPGTTGRTQTPQLVISLDEATQTNGLKLYSNASCSSAISSPVNGSAGTNSITTSTLSSNVSTDIYAKATDLAGNSSCSATLATYRHDDVAPATPGSISATAGNSQVALSWSAPSGSPTAYMVLRCTSTCDTDPTQGTSYSLNATLGNGTVKYLGTSTNFTDTGLTNGTLYHYSIYAKDDASNWSPSGDTSGTPTSGGGTLSEFSDGGQSSNTTNRYIFMSEQQYTMGTLGILQTTLTATFGADSICENLGRHATSVTKNLLHSTWSWNALLAVYNKTIRDRFGLPNAVSYNSRMSNNTDLRIAASETHLFNQDPNNHDTYANVSVAGNEITGAQYVWSGNATNNCTNWTSTTASVKLGISNELSGVWISGDEVNCGGGSYLLRCISTPPAFVFISSTTNSGNYDPSGGPDTYCSTLANASTSITKDLGVTRWRAVTPGDGPSPGLTPREKLALPYNTKVYLSDKTTLIASSESQLFNDAMINLASAINKDENGATVSGADIWTASISDGCQTTSGGNIQYFKRGDNAVNSKYSNNNNQGNAWWTNSSEHPCDQAKRLICIGQ